MTVVNVWSPVLVQLHLQARVLVFVTHHQTVAGAWIDCHQQVAVRPTLPVSFLPVIRCH